MKEKLIFMGQTYGMCGPASLRLAAAYFGIRVSEEELGRVMGVTPDTGVDDFEQMYRGANHLGFKYIAGRDYTLEQLMEVKSRGAQVVLCWMTGGKNADIDNDGHFSLLRSLTEDTVTLSDTMNGGELLTFPRTAFENMWFDWDGEQKQKRWSMILVNR